MIYQEYPHVASYRIRTLGVVDMEPVAAKEALASFPCDIEPLEPEQVTTLSFIVDNPQKRITWPPIEGKVLEAGEEVVHDGQTYRLEKILGDIYRGYDEYYTGVLCGSKSSV